MTPAFRIKSCSDRMRWYCVHIGEVFPLIRIDSEGYWTREPAGYLNVVLARDVELMP